MTNPSVTTITTEEDITDSEEVVQFLWRAPKQGDAGIILGGDPAKPLKRVNDFYFVIESNIQHSFVGSIMPFECCKVLKTTIGSKHTFEDLLAIQYFLTAEKPVKNFFSAENIAAIGKMLGGYHYRYLVDISIIA
jgi:hypothetical protein